MELKNQLVNERTKVELRLAALRRDFEALVEGAELEPPDDEHDPDGTTAYERAQFSSMAEGSEATLAAIDLALGAIDEAEDFGVCAACGELIGFERLVALPAVRYCVKCAAAGF